ncbi:ABC transporter permease [Paenibacillus sp. p3-SID867]|uniref:ABC transporter permease n=1 Tax=Paenibacillus sp. p3-SID867 TaxID=2916363 RepID=UPI0021A4A858|nr:ABC transporter permease [Paenibacillus sp. p3-SID867]MCT1402208.1 ABC transporter permease [Paenibacillus sp. p3-SID867]
MTFRQFAFRNVLRNKRTYAAYFLSSAFSVMIFFVCALFLFHPSIAGEMFYPVVIQAMLGAELIMYVFSFFFVLYSVGAFLKTRKREFGILFMHGMTDRQFNKMVFLENMIIGVSAIATGILFGVITGKLFLMAGSAFLGIPPLPFRLPLRALGLTVASYVLLFIIISLCTSWLLRPKALIDLFQSGQRPKTAPRTSPWLAILATVLLVVSYSLAATTSASTLALRMFPVTFMTMIGTYLLYTQLGVALVRRLKQSRRLAWRRTKLISLSSLHYRLRDHAQMFSMVTIVLAVSFCSVGVFASIPVLTKQFNEDFPAAIGYLAKTGDISEKQHLHEIRQELESKKIPFETLSFRVKYTEAQPASAQVGQLQNPLALISFSDYKAAVLMAGLPFDEQPLSGEDALVLIASQNDRAYIRHREHASYRIHDSEILLHETGYSDHVGVPEYLLPEMDNDSRFGGLVVSDETFAAITNPVRLERYTGFYVDDFTKTEGIVPHLAPRGAVRYEMGQPYALAVSGTLFALRDSLYNMLLFAALLVGTVFFIAAGSFLYFRLYADLDYDRRHYATISRLGMTDKEFRRIVTGQLALLFFVPIGLAIVHSIFAFVALQSYFYLSIAAEMGIVLISFLMMQVMYFFFIRSQYLRKLKQTLI